MRLKLTKSKNATSLYVIKSTYENKRNSSKIVEKLGTYDDLLKKLNGADPIAWAKEYIAQLNEEEKAAAREVSVSLSPVKPIINGKKRLFNGGYLFLQSIYHRLGLDDVCRVIAGKHKFSFNLDAVFSGLIYGRIIFPSSKLETYKQAKSFIEQPDFDLQHVYRALEAVALEADFIQAEVYKNSMKVLKRRTGVIYYDCTNYFFEIEEEDGHRCYGHSKEHRPNPIVQMGLFMDSDGLPLSFSITPGNTNEQVTLKPLERKLIDDFKLSRFVVCTDAGLSSTANRKFNDVKKRAFVTTQSVKKLKSHIKNSMLFNAEGWHLSDSSFEYNIAEIEADNELREKYYNRLFFKERWIREGELEQKLVITFSLKYKNYQRKIRNNQIERALFAIDKDPGKITKKNANDYRRFIKQEHCTASGEPADKEQLLLNHKQIESEAVYDGFYAVCTNLEDEALSIINIIRSRWEIEECFRIMKSEFKTRPVFLRREDRIKAHFLTCFIALLIYRILEKKLGNKFTCHEIITTLREMNFLHHEKEGYQPTYEKTEITDTLHEVFGFRSDTEIVSCKNMNKIIKQTKK